MADSSLLANLGAIMLALRLGLLVSAIHHLWEASVRPDGISWRSPAKQHLQSVATSIAAFAVGAAALVAFDFSVDPRLIPADLGIMALVIFAISYPPWNAVSVKGITVAGRNYGWDIYIGHDAEPQEDGYQLVRLEYRVWKFSVRRSFLATPEAVKGLDYRGKVPDGRKIGTRAARRRGWS